MKDLYCSYKDLPLSLYQIQTKYRDEARPRAGLLRGREFTMKDSYSFDVDDAGLDRSYAAHRDAYIKIFDRLGLDYVIVSAMSGAMGGSKSEEFLHPTAIGEDTFVRSPGGYAANVEAVHHRRAPTPIPLDGLPEAHVEDTPDTPTIETLVAVAQQLFPDAGYTAASTLKNVVVTLVHPDGTREPLVIGAARRPRGRRQAARGAGRAGRGRAVHRLRRATRRWSRATSARRCWARESESKIRYLVDPRVVPGTRWITGANEPGKHVFDLVAGRDFTWDGVIEAAEVRAGDPAPDGSGPLELARGIEIGPHLPARPQVRRGARPQGARRERQARHRHDGLLRRRRLPGRRGDRRVQPRRARPGLAARGRAGRRARRRHRQGRRGLRGAPRRWPPSWSPPGSTVLYDDRPKVSPGREVQGRRAARDADDRDRRAAGWPRATIEVRDRATGEREEVPVAEAAARVLAAVRG